MNSIARLAKSVLAFVAQLTRWAGGVLTKRLNMGLFIAGLLVAFLYGMGTADFKAFPYYEMRPAFTLVKRFTGAQPQAVQVATGQVYETTKKLSTALLPLTIGTFNLKQKVSMTDDAGGICQLGKDILVVDRMGLPFRFALDNHDIEKLGWPALPNNYDAFLDSPKAIAKINFRVHDVNCSTTATGYRILFSHEFFNPATGQTNLVISSLEIGNDLAPLNGAAWQRVFTSTPLPSNSFAANGAGGRMALNGKGHLYLTVGDYNLDGVLYPGKVAQDPSTDQGSVLRIDLKTGEKHTVSIGHRNPQGLVILKDGEILISEQGPKGGDELNRIEDGKNYGWPEVTYGTDYDLYSWPNSKTQGRHPGYEKPVFAWVPSVATNQLIEVHDFNERWNGDLLMGSLKAGTLFRIRYEDGVVRYVEPIWFGPRIRDVIELGNHQIALWTDQRQIILISVDERTLETNKRVVSAVIPPGSVNCMACHHVGLTNENDAAPSLSGIVGRKVASDNFAHYSDALKNLGGTWTEDRLRSFLLNPNEFAPGTNMVIGEQSKSQVDRAITYLKSLD